MIDVVPGKDGAVERDLDVTRTRLGGHLDQLRDRMTPGQVLDDVVRYFRGREGADFGRSLLSNVKENPLPAAVTSVGLAWLMATNGRTAVVQPRSVIPLHAGAATGDDATTTLRRQEISAARSRMRLAEESVGRQDGESDDAHEMRRADARGFAVGVARQPEDTSESFSARIRTFLADSKQSIADGLHEAGSGLNSAASSASGALSGYGSSAQDAVANTAGKARDAMSAGGQAAAQAGSRWTAALADSPIVMGVLSLAAGALLGALLPQSETEETALAGVAGRVRDTATGLAHDGLDKGSAVAASVLDAGTSSVHEHGLAGEKSLGTLVDAAISGDLASDAKEVVADVMQAGDEAIRKTLPDAEARASAMPA